MFTPRHRNRVSKYCSNNGLTTNLNGANGANGDKPHGVVETFSYDKNPNTFKEMLAGDTPTVRIVELKPISGLDL